MKGESMKIKDAIKEAVRNYDGQRAGRIVDQLRFRNGANYALAYALFEKHTGISESAFEALMYESDYYSFNG